MTATRGAAFAATHGMINRVHGDAAVVRHAATPAGCAGLAPTDVLVVEIADLANRRRTVDVDLAGLTGRQTDLRLGAFLCHQLRAGAGRASHLTTATGLELDVVDGGAHRDVLQRQRVAGLDVRSFTGGDGV